MTNTRLRLFLFTLLAAVALAGCDSVPFMDNTPDYKSASRGKPLEVPPDLTSVSTSDIYSVPGGGATYSQFTEGQAQQAQKPDQILASPDTIKLERAGAQRWLVVQSTPEKVWPVVREFWTDMGFAIIIENSKTGVMETEWTDATDINKGDQNYLDRFQNWMDKLGALNNRIKFRTRLDQDTENHTTDIYLSHRLFSNVPDDGKVRVTTQLGVVETGFKHEDFDKNKKLGRDEQAAAEDFDAEMLRRLMVKLGVSEQQSRAIVASQNQEQRASLTKDKSGNISLAIADQFDRAWRRVSLSLDRIGFVVEDRDRSRGLFYLRYSNIEGEGNGSKKGFLDKLKFWGDDEKDSQETPASKPDEKSETKSQGSSKDKAGAGKQYRLKLESTENGSILYVTDKNGQRDNSSTASSILNMLYEQLK
jgi:outer membrane protein assembly factor BamC